MKRRKEKRRQYYFTSLRRRGALCRLCQTLLFLALSYAIAFCSADGAGGADGGVVSIVFFRAPKTTGVFADDDRGGMDAHCRSNLPQALRDAGYQESKSFFYSPTNIRTLRQLFTGSEMQGLALTESEVETVKVQLLLAEEIAAPNTALKVSDFYTLETKNNKIHSAVIDAIDQIHEASDNDDSKNFWFFIHAGNDNAYAGWASCTNATSSAPNRFGRPPGGGRVWMLGDNPGRYARPEPIPRDENGMPTGSPGTNQHCGTEIPMFCVAGK